MTSLRALYDRLDNARIDYASTMGDGFYQKDWMGAGDVEDTGILIGKEAMTKPEDEREEFIESEIAKHDIQDQHLLSCAARYQIAVEEGK